MPSIGALHRPPGWFWIICRGCGHGRPTALAPFVIRWGYAESSDRLRKAAVCTKCGVKGALLQHPSWRDMDVGWQPFPELTKDEKRT